MHMSTPQSPSPPPDSPPPSSPPVARDPRVFRMTRDTAVSLHLSLAAHPFALTLDGTLAGLYFSNMKAASASARYRNNSNMFHGRWGVTHLVWYLTWMQSDLDSFDAQVPFLYGGNGAFDTSDAYKSWLEQAERSALQKRVTGRTN